MYLLIKGERARVNSTGIYAFNFSVHGLNVAYVYSHLVFGFVYHLTLADIPVCFVIYDCKLPKLHPRNSGDFFFAYRGHTGSDWCCI